MDTALIVLIILAIIYVPMWCWVKFSPKAKEYRLSTWGPAIMLRTSWGLELMGKLGRYKKFWRYCGIFSRVVVILLMAYIVSLLVIDLIALPSIIGKKGLGIEYALAIPGLNPMIPLVYGWIALIIAMCVHELAHGIQTRANDMDVDSSGVLHLVVPMGAFVEPNEEQLTKANRRSKWDVYAAGITTNFCLGMICFILMFGAMTAGVTVNHGDNAAIYGTTEVNGSYSIENTAIILGIGHYEDKSSYTEINTLKGFNDYLNENCKGTDAKDHQFLIKYDYHNKNYETTSKPVYLGVYVNQVVDNSPAAKAQIKKGDFICGMTIDGQTEMFGTNGAWSDYMKKTTPNKDAVLYGLRYNYATQTYDSYYTDVKLSEKNGVGYLGVSTTTGGYSYTTPNSLREASLNPFYGGTDLASYAMGFLSFVGKPFQGFSPVPEVTHWWYDSNVLPDNIFWIIVSLLFWIFWLNFVLGVTNAIPAVPFDGGFLFAGGLDYILEKFGVKDEKQREEKVDRVVSVTSMIMVGILVLVVLVIVI